MSVVAPKILDLARRVLNFYFLKLYEFSHTFTGCMKSEMAINNPEIKVNIKILKHLMFINFY